MKPHALPLSLQFQALISILAILLPFVPLRAELLVKDGQKVAFFGDSTTQYGSELPGGYVNLVVSGLAIEGVKIVPIPAGGRWGNTSNEMLARLDRNVLSKQPDWMTLSCGLNDVMGNPASVDLETYKKNIASIVDQAQAKGVKVMIMTSTMAGEDISNPNNQKLAGYNDFLRQLAKERNLPLADINSAFQDAVTAAKPARGTLVLMVDNERLNPDGHRLMAHVILKALGVSDADMLKVEAAWDAQPGGAIIDSRLIFVAPAPPTLAEYDLFNKTALSKGTTVEELMTKFYYDAVRRTLDAHAQESGSFDMRQLQIESAQYFMDQIKGYIGEQPTAAPVPPAKPNP
jgi:lysophospholipase L1-like esterase